VYDPVVVPPPPQPPPPPLVPFPLPQPAIRRSPARARPQRTRLSSLFWRVSRGRRLTPKRARPGIGNHNAAPVRLADPVFTVVTVRVEVTLPLAAKDPEVGLNEHVGGVAAVEVIVQPNCTVPEAPVEFTVTVAVPVLPRPIALGDTDPTATVNCGALAVYFTTNGVRGVGNGCMLVLVRVVWNAPGVTGKSLFEIVWPVT